MCVCARACGAPGSVFSLHFPVGFQLPRQFRGGPWARGCSPPPCIKARRAFGKLAQLPSSATETALPHLLLPLRQLGPWEAPTVAPFFSFTVSALGP